VLIRIKKMNMIMRKRKFRKFNTIIINLFKSFIQSNQERRIRSIIRGIRVRMSTRLEKRKI